MPPLQFAAAPALDAKPPLAARIQALLLEFYQLDEQHSVLDFVRPAAHGGREELLIRQEAEALEVALVLPSDALSAESDLSLDVLCQVIEGVSHFVYVLERARRELPTTQLELELQAEIDKFVVLGLLGVARDEDTQAPTSLLALRERLYERVLFSHEEDTDEGSRYRTANLLAARFTSKIEKRLERAGEAQVLLRRFYGLGQTEKIELALAA